MGKQKYNEEQFTKAIEMRLAGYSSPEIMETTTVGKEAQNKLYRERGIKMTPEAAKKARERRWANHQPVVEGKKCCSKCKEWKILEDFAVNNDDKTGRTRICRACDKSYYEANREKKLAAVKDYKLRNLDKVKALARKHYELNRDKKIQQATQWNKENKDAAQAISRKSGKKHQKKKNARTAKYRADQIMATPEWLTEEQLIQIRFFYESCPKDHHVDHIVPLRGENVSGLHVPWNLQHLLALDNMSKGNKHK